MTQALKTLVDPTHAATYHCVARCVRRSWLCGFDSYARKNFEHRKPWVERRILEMGEIFACGIYAFEATRQREAALYDIGFVRQLREI